MMALGLFTAIYAAADELGALAGIGACSCGGTGCRIFEKARKIHDAYFLCGSDEAPLERNFEREANNPELGESALVGCIRKMKDTVAKETAWYAQFCNECEELLRLETALRDEALPSYAAPAAVRAPLRPPFNLPARCFKLAVHQISLILRFLDNSPLWAGRLQRRIDDYLADLASEHSRVLHGRPASAEYRAATASLRLYDFFGNLKRSTALPNDYELASKLRAFQQTLIQRGSARELQAQISASEKIPMDIYDNMLNSIQQFPLDANYFERRIKRAKKRHSYCLAKFRKILRQIPNHDADAYMRVQKRLARCIKQKIKIIKKFMRCLGTQIGNLEESDKLSGCLLNIKKLAPDGCSLVRIKEEVPLASRVCACKTNDGGLLICCDAPDCTVRWYHYKCMGLSAVPTGRWYCEKCRKAAHPSD